MDADRGRLFGYRTDRRGAKLRCGGGEPPSGRAARWRNPRMPVAPRLSRHAEGCVRDRHGGEQSMGGYIDGRLAPQPPE